MEKFPVLSRPTRSLDGEIWVQCQLRLTFRFQANHGISLHLCDPSRRCLRIGIGEILDHRSGRAIYNAMLWTELTDEFQDNYLDHLKGLGLLDPEKAERLAFNLAMDSFWDEIEQSAVKYCRNEVEANREDREAGINGLRVAAPRGRYKDDLDRQRQLQAGSESITRSLAQPDV